MSIAHTDRIYMSAHRHLAGAELVGRLRAAGFDNLVLRSHAELDSSPSRVEQPDHVFVAAARLGGILASDSYPAEFVRQTLAIQTNVSP